MREVSLEEEVSASSRELNSRLGAMGEGEEMREVCGGVSLEGARGRSIENSTSPLTHPFLTPSLNLTNDSQSPNTNEV